MTPTNQFFAPGPQGALEIAIRADDVGAMARALSNGATANALGQFDITPLMVAVDSQSVHAVEALLNAGALPNAKALDGNGPVSLAVKSCRARPNGRDIMLAIFKGGGDPNTRQPDRDPVLMRFILDHDAEGLKLMKSLGADLNILDRAGRPLITNVAMSQDWDMVWALIELGAEVDYENGKSTQPLSKALSLRYPSPDSPLYSYKVKVWQFLKDKGLPVQPLKQ
jgi:cytohesin